MPTPDRYTVAVCLRHGPQDGALVKMYQDAVCPEIWVGPAWLGDGFSAFTTAGKCRRFPAKYRYDRECRYYVFVC